MKFARDRECDPSSRLGLLRAAALFVMLCFFDIVFRMDYCEISFGDAISAGSFRFTLLWALLLCAIYVALPGLLQRFYMPLLTFAMCALCMTHSILNSLTGNFLTFADLAYAGDGAKFFSFTYFTMKPKTAAFCICALCAALLISVCFRRSPYSPASLTIAAMVFACCIINLFQLNEASFPAEEASMSWENIQIDRSGDEYVYQNMDDTHRGMEVCGLYQYSFRSYAVATGLDDAMQFGEMEARLDEYFEEKRLEGHEGNDYTGLLAGKNCILVLLESIDSWMLTEDYMPNLYAIQQESVDFENHFTNLFINASTFNTEFMVNTGLFTPSSGVSTAVYTDNYFPNALARLFEDAGYTSKSFHGADPTIYNRENIHLNFGYEAYHYYPNMGMDDYMLDSQLTRGFFKMSGADPFFSFVITYSGHGPYTEELANISDPHIAAARRAIAKADIPEKAKESEEYALAIAHAMETDAFAANLMKELKKSGHGEDTVLVFFADHYCKYMTDTELVMELKGAEDMDMICRTPFFIWSKDLEPQKIEKVTSSVDVAPTIANLFGLDAKWEYFAGDDAFSDGGGVAIFRGGSWYDGTVHSGDPTSAIQEKLQVFTDVLRCDYFRRKLAGST